jgi:hypothetical protein
MPSSRAVDERHSPRLEATRSGCSRLAIQAVRPGSCTWSFGCGLRGSVQHLLEAWMIRTDDEGVAMRHGRLDHGAGGRI